MGTELDDLIKVQCTHGTFDYNEYHFGLANGLILARSVLDGKDPEFMEKPDEWLVDRIGKEAIEEAVCG